MHKLEGPDGEQQNSVQQMVGTRLYIVDIFNT